MRDILLYFAVKYHGNFNDMYHALKNKEEVPTEEIMKCKAGTKHKFVTTTDSNYPEIFKTIYNPPLVL